MSNAELESWIGAQLGAAPLRARSLVVTLFGDSIEPHGGTVWIGSLINLLRPFGIAERSVRTSVFRLTKEGWLETVGGRSTRRSFYRLTPAGRQRAARAHRRIYDEARQTWNGRWTLLLLRQDAGAALRQDLEWQGFGRFLPHLYGHPAPDPRVVEELIATHGSSEGITAFRADTLEIPGSESAIGLVQRGWPLDDLARQYEAFAGRFAALLKIRKKHSGSASQDFVLRSLLIHEFRRAQLRDPRMPPSLLPEAWPGTRARDLCRDLYRMCSPGAEQHLMAAAESHDGALRPPAPYFFERFGGMTLEHT